MVGEGGRGAGIDRLGGRYPVGWPGLICLWVHTLPEDSIFASFLANDPLDLVPRGSRVFGGIGVGFGLGLNVVVVVVVVSTGQVVIDRGLSRARVVEP